MTCRSLRVWMFACVLLSVLAVSARAQDCAKPPDLPVDPNDTIPVLTPPSIPEIDETPAPAPMEPLPGWPTITIRSVSPFGFGPQPFEHPPMEIGEPTTLTIYPGKNGVVVSINPEPMPQMVTISHPVRPRVPLSVQRTFDECVLIGAHPLLSLLPLPESLREERHTQEVVQMPQRLEGMFPPGGMLPAPPPGAMLTPDLSIPIAANSSCGGEQQSSQPEPIHEMPQPKEDNDQVCPYHGPCDRHVEAIGDEDIAHSVMANLEKLIEAEQIYETACKLAENGHYADAMKCIEKASGLCSPGRFEDMKVEVVSHILSSVICGGHEDSADAEEADEPPMECVPEWFGDDDDGSAQKPAQQSPPTSESSGCSHNSEHCGSTQMCYRNTPATPMVERKLMTQVTVSYKDVPLQQVIDDLRQTYDLNLAIDTASLKGINFDRTLSLVLDDVSLKMVLDFMLKKYGLDYVVKDDFIVITTEAVAHGAPCYSIYFVGDLIGCQAKTCATAEKLIKLITNAIEPNSWSDFGGTGDIDFFPLSQTLVIHQVRVRQEQVADLLDALRRQENEKFSCGQKVVSVHGCGMPCKEPGVAEQVTGLMKACHLALGCGHYEKAAQLAREAHALDAERVAADPVVYKIHLLAEHKDKGCCCCPDDCCCGDKDCCCPGNVVVKGNCVIRGILVNNMPALPCPLVQETLPPSKASPCRVEAMWNRSLVIVDKPESKERPQSSICGRVYFFGADGVPLQVDSGSLCVGLFDCTPRSYGKGPVKIHEWRIDPVTLKNCLKQDVLGWGYTLCLPWPEGKPFLSHIQLKVRYEREKLAPLFGDSGPLTFEESQSSDKVDKDCCDQGKCEHVQMLPPALPPVDATVVAALQKLLDEKVATAKPALEVVEEESEEHETPKAVDKPYRVRTETKGTVISFDELLQFIPGETWTEFDPKTNHVRALYRVRVGNAVYCVRYDGELSLDLSVTPASGCGERCEEK